DRRWPRICWPMSDLGLLVLVAVEDDPGAGDCCGGGQQPGCRVGGVRDNDPEYERPDHAAGSAAHGGDAGGSGSLIRVSGCDGEVEQTVPSPPCGIRERDCRQQEGWYLVCRSSQHHIGDGPTTKHGGNNNVF